MSSAPKPIAAQKKPVTIYKEGYIWKKCPTGIKGFRKWQKRWFVITDKAILYYKKQGDTEPLGVIPLMQIVDAEYLPEKRVGCRFDVRVKNLRVYSLHGSGVDDAKIWTHAINEAMIRAKSTDDTFGPSKKSDTTVKLTKLQVLFARARGGFDASKHGSKEEQKAQMTLKMQFPTDGDLLKHFLHVILEPKTGAFDFDMADEKDEKVDAEDEVKEQKKDEFGNPIVNPEAEKTPTTPVIRTDKCKLEICNATVEPKTDFCIFHQGRSLPKPEQHTKGTGSISGPINPQMSAKEMKEKGLQVLPIVAQAATNKGITEMFHSKEFIRYLCDVFNSPDKVAHGYAVRVMWSVFRGIYSQAEAAGQFAAYIDIHASAAKFNMEIKGALLTILLQTPAKVLQQTDKLTISFYMPVHNPTTWQALLHCLNNSDFPVRKSALEDINTILHDNFDNCRSLRRNKNWQSWVYSIVTDIPKSKNQDPVLKTVFAYCVNVVTLVHFQYYMKKAFFYGVMEESLHRLHQFGGSTSEGSRIASTMLAALCSKLGAQQKSFSQDKDSVEWRNLWQLTRVIRKFVFQTAYWQTGAGVTKDLAASAVVPQTEEKKEDSDQMGGPLRLGGISSPNTSNNQRIKVMKMERDKSAEFVLYKCRVGKAERTFTDDPELTDCGLHWNDDGRCGDVALVQKVAELFKQLHVHEFNAELNPTMSSKEKDFLLQCVKEFEFWEDCKQFVELVHKADIEERKLLSYRKMSFLVQNWLAANYSRNDRKAVIAEINGIIKDRAKADKKAATLKVESRDSIMPNSAQASSLPPSSPTNRGANQGGSFSAGNQGPLDMSSLPPHLREKQKLGKQQSFHERGSAPPPPANDDD